MVTTQVVRFKPALALFTMHSHHYYAGNIPGALQWARGSQFTVGCIQGDIGFTLDFRVKLLGVSQEPDKLRIRLGIEPLFYQFNLEPRNFEPE
jgi:hypothetical protein